MGLARKYQINLSNTHYYHCVSRCVRRAFLCGEDMLTGKSYEHRRAWVEMRLLFLSKIFCLDVCAYAVMPNHTHVVLYIDDKKAQRLNDKAILLRWSKLYKVSSHAQQFLQGECLNEGQKGVLSKEINEYRSRLASISWFMRGLNEHIARRANQEDECTGHFWEGRFKSQALLDVSALLACMAYVDLNPIRAELASNPEDSEHTSIKLRCELAKKCKQPKYLARFLGNTKRHMHKGIPFELRSYLDLVDSTGRCIRADKPGVIDPRKEPILEQLGLEARNWLKLTTQLEQTFHGAIGSADSIEAYCEHRNLRRRSNISQSQRLFT
ncbi:transposase [Pseudoalteromonas sp. BMB]|uniref:transposase n=1 Tax=Pseudoalteromonas sp. BMB TaxID=1874619 RepID=UPI00083DCE14|nr:transposase [Pseudoalteromonas sp. BMB]ODB42258.1 transposase [Pseudoalteromonas sp. BMB]